MNLHPKRASTSTRRKAAGAEPGASAVKDAAPVTNAEAVTAALEALRHARPGGPTRRAAQKRRNRRIVEAAVALADEGGFEGVKTRDICERAGVSMSTLYREFESKEEIVLQAFAEDLLLLEAHFARRPAEGTSAHARVDAFFRVAVGAFFARPNYARAIIAALASGQHRPLAQLETLLGRMTRLIDDALVGVGVGARTDAATDAGVSTPGTDPPDRARDPKRAAIILHRVWFALVVGWSASVYATEQVLAELAATTAYLLSSDSDGPPMVAPRVARGA